MAEEQYTSPERVASLKELSLTDVEISYLTTPLKLMKPEQRMTAMAIWDRRNNLVAALNDEFRRKQAEDEVMAKSGEEVELADDEDIASEGAVTDNGAVRTQRIGGIELSEPSESLADVR